MFSHSIVIYILTELWSIDNKSTKNCNRTESFRVSNVNSSNRSLQSIDWVIAIGLLYRKAVITLLMHYLSAAQLNSKDNIS